jgi:hypothetical protein
MNSKEKIHSIVELGGKVYNSISLAINEQNIIYTVLRQSSQMLNVGDDITVVSTYINGPLLKVNLDETFTKDLEIKVTATPAYLNDKKTDPKKITIRHIENSLVNTLEVQVSDTSKPEFKVDKEADIEDYLKITGAVVDLNLTGTNASFFKLKGRKANAGSFPATSVNNSNTGLMKFKNYLISNYNGKQLQFNYQPGTSKVDGRANGRFPESSTTALPFYTMYEVSEDVIRFAMQGTGSNTNKYYIRDTSIAKDGESTQIKFSTETWTIDKDPKAFSLTIMGSQSKVWSIQTLNDGNNRYKISMYVEENSNFTKKKETTINLEKKPTVTSWVIDGDDLYLLYGW